MKKQFMLMVLLVILGLAKAQDSTLERSEFYFNMDLHLGTHIGGGLGANIFMDEKNAFQIGYFTLAKKSRAMPSDFHGGLSGLLTLGLNHPKDKIRTGYFSYARGVYLNPQKTNRALLSVGLGFGTQENKVNFRRTSQNAFLGPNYTWTTEKVPSVSLVLGCRFEFLLTKPYGLSAFSPTLILSPGKSYIGLSFGQMLGTLR
ncbi:MAG: hypothetical protein R3B47_03895 [Bacteroidia bacterium]